ncbi:MAG: flavodoxin family protein [Bacteroidaceae bacterium]|nr:flavodoxin family protein [Bacteroidaceae bacterium]
MKVTVITGSAHKNGTSALMAEKFIEGATEAGHEVFRFDAGLKNIHGCVGCETCSTMHEGCVFKDDMLELNPHILEADVIVFASPIYYYNINAQTKAVMDRFHANNSALLGNKKAALLVTMAGDKDSAEGAVVFFKNYCKYMKWENLGVIAAKNSWIREYLEESEFPNQAYKLGKNLK